MIHLYPIDSGSGKLHISTYKVATSPSGPIYFSHLALSLSEEEEMSLFLVSHKAFFAWPYYRNSVVKKQ